MKRNVLSPEAQDDIEAIKAYLVETAGVRVARYVLREIRSGVNFVASNPGAGHRREDLSGAPVLFWSVFSYLIIYDPAKRPVEIVRVLHGHRDVTGLLDKR